MNLARRHGDAQDSFTSDTTNGKLNYFHVLKIINCSCV